MIFTQLKPGTGPTIPPGPWGYEELMAEPVNTVPTGSLAITDVELDTLVVYLLSV
jgi:hypothetical protein